MDKIYVDTNVYLDLFLGRKDRYLPLDEFALCAFDKIKKGKYALVISDWVIEELIKHCNEKIINDFLRNFNGVIQIKRTSEDEDSARKLSPTNYPDALHVILAKKENCFYLVTRNLRDFAEFQEIIEIVTPEYL